MLAHYLTLALRNLKRAPLTSAINVFTLALGLTAFVAVYAIVSYWNNSERHFSNAPRSYVITANMALRDGSIATGTIPQTNELYARYLALEFPEFEAIAKANLWSREASISVDGRGERVAALAVDPAFLDIFDLPFLSGDPRSALLQPDGVLLTEQTARRLFGGTDVLGRTLSLGGNLLDATVTGVLGPLPQPSHLGDSAAASLRFDLIAPWGLYERLRTAVSVPALDADDESGRSADTSAAEAAPPPAANENWLGGYCCTTYVMLRADSTLTEAALNARLADFAERRMAPELLQMASLKVGAVPLSGLMVSTLNAQLLGGATGAVSITSLLFALAALVLGVACVNYANLATAQALRRAREIGLRKALGARRRQVALQHLSEAALLSAAALALAVLAVVLLAPPIQTALGIDLRLGLFADGRLWLFLLALLLGVTLLAGGYPALVLSRLRPSAALQLGRLRQGPRRVSALLVGAQFSAASLLLIAVIVMQLQNLELRRGGLGQTQDPYLLVSNFEPVTRVDNERLLRELQRLPQVTGLTQMASAPWSDNVNLALFTRDVDAGATPVTAYWNTVGQDFFAVMDLPLVAGRVFARDRNDLPPEPGAALSLPRNIVIDRPYAAQLGFATPEEAVDALVYEPSQFGPERPARIIGVVESRPLYLRGFGATANAYGLGETGALQNQILRLARGELGAGLSAIDSAWRDMGALVPLQRRFLDELFEENYRNFARINQAFAGLAFFAIVIALIGLFGMALQTTSRRLHEIGLRKALGAQSGQILGMLLYAFSKPVLLANLLAWPLAFLAAQSYLSIFIQRVQLTPLPFVLSLIFVLTVAGLAISGQALRAARSAPAAVLRGE